VESRLPAGQDTENLRKEISDAGAPEKTFPGRRPREERQGLEGPERARTIRRTAAKKRRRQEGSGGPELCDGTPWTQQPAAPADARQLVGAQRKPGRALRACTSLPGPRTTQPDCCPGRPPAAAARHLAVAGLAVRRRQPPTQASHLRRTARPLEANSPPLLCGAVDHCQDRASGFFRLSLQLLDFLVCRGGFALFELDLPCIQR
jgi:hypothetical protein